jgi:hypothetical protein
MKKYLIIILLAAISQQLFSQNEAIYTKKDTMALSKPKSDIVTTRTGEAALLKPTFFNMARFLSYRGTEITLDRGMQVAVPGLTHSFSLTKNTLVQINQTVTFSTSGCFSCPEAWLMVWIYIDDRAFARFNFTGADKGMSLSGSSLAQLGPGLHTIRLDVSGSSNTGDIKIYGGGSHSEVNSNGVLVNVINENVTHMSLLFFPEE